MKLTEKLTNYIQHTFSGDLRQEIILKILEMDGTLPDFKTKIDMAKWVSTVTSNMRRNQQFIEGNRYYLLQEHAPEAEEWNYVPSTNDPMEDYIVHEELTERFDKLSTLLRDTLEEYYIEGKTMKEIAERTGDSEMAVRLRLFRARNIVKGEDDG